MKYQIISEKGYHEVEADSVSASDNVIYLHKGDTVVAIAVNQNTTAVVPA